MSIIDTAEATMRQLSSAIYDTNQGAHQPTAAHQPSPNVQPAVPAVRSHVASGGHKRPVRMGTYLPHKAGLVNRPAGTAQDNTRKQA